MVTNQKLDEMSQKNTSKIICHNFGNAKTQINIFPFFLYMQRY